MQSLLSPVARASALLLFLIAAACEQAPEQCETRSGTYQLRWFEQTGNCGPIPDQILTVDEMTMISPECSGRIENSEDDCEVTLIDFTCPEPGIGAGVTSTANGKVNWSTDGIQADGALNMVIRDADGIVLCQSSYDVEYDRL